MKELCLLLLVLTDLRLLATGRLSTCIRWLAAQGLLLGLFAFWANPAAPTMDVYFAAGVAVVLKALVFPYLLGKTVRRIESRREGRPYVGYIASLLCGLAALVLAKWIAAALPLIGPVSSQNGIGVALFSMFCGLFLIVGRRQALFQVVGYLVLDNGIYILAMGMLLYTPLTVELGVMLDLFAAVLVMAVTVQNIHRAFSHVDASRLNRLKG